MAELRKLLDILTKAVETIEKTCQEEGVSIPNLADRHAYDDSLPPMKYTIAAKEATGAAMQLMAIMNPAEKYLFEHRVYGYLEQSAMQVALRAKAADTIAKHGGQAHADLITKESGVPFPAGSVARCLRALCQQHIFRETALDTFANTRLSLVFKDSPAAALVRSAVEDTLPPAAAMYEALIDPAFASSNAPNKTAMNKAFNTDKTWWDFLNQHGNEERLQNFTRAMLGSGTLNVEAVAKDYPWDKLGSATVVDVGGNLGDVSLALAKRFPNLKLVNQDLPKVIERAKVYWEQNGSDLIKNGRVILQGYNFFDPQPVKNADVYYLKVVLHDWHDAEVEMILANIKAVMSRNSKLMLQERVLLPSYSDDTWPASMAKAPEPLLPNYGGGSVGAQFSDLKTLVMLNALERTYSQWAKVLAASGFKIDKVWDIRAKESLIECTLA